MVSRDPNLFGAITENGDDSLWSGLIVRLKQLVWCAHFPDVAVEVLAAGCFDHKPL